MAHIRRPGWWREQTCPSRSNHGGLCGSPRPTQDPCGTRGARVRATPRTAKPSAQWRIQHDAALPGKFEGLSQHRATSVEQVQQDAVTLDHCAQPILGEFPQLGCRPLNFAIARRTTARRGCAERDLDLRGTTASAESISCDMDGGWKALASITRTRVCRALARPARAALRALAHRLRVNPQHTPAPKVERERHRGVAPAH
jgi:hypothetical protein